MQLRQIKHFLSLCEELSFTRAARRCHVSQPSLTKSIRALEAELGGVLFRRKPTIELSVIGRALRPFFDGSPGLTRMRAKPRAFSWRRPAKRGAGLVPPIVRAWCHRSRTSEVALERDDFSFAHHPALAYWWSMIFSENRYPLFGIMLEPAHLGGDAN